MSLVSFLNLNKYPPSLLFLLMTLGPVLLALRALDARTPAALRPALVIGKVPMFYYLAHILTLHLVALGASLARYATVRPAIESPSLDRFPMTQLPGWPRSGSASSWRSIRSAAGMQASSAGARARG
jgi:hypothetical protein